MNNRVIIASILIIAIVLGGCTFAYVPGEQHRLRICVPPRAWQCDPRYEGSDM